MTKVNESTPAPAPAPAPAAAPLTPMATIPPVADIVTPESQPDSSEDYSGAGPTDRSIQESADLLASIYVGSAKSKGYRTSPIGEMMPAHFYRSVSTMAQPAMANLRWSIANFLHRVVNVDCESPVSPQWLINLPTHLQFEAALELARVHPHYRLYALFTLDLMSKSSKSRGVPGVTAKSNPYDALLREDAGQATKARVVADMVCSLRSDLTPSPYAVFGRGAVSPSPDTTAEWVRQARDPAYRTPLSCHAEIAKAVRAGIRLWRGPGARKIGEKHKDLRQVSERAYDEAAPLYDTNIQRTTGEGLSHYQCDSTSHYLDILEPVTALVTDPRYASYMQTVMAPPVDADTQQVVYSDTYHSSLASALKRIPRWSWVFPDSAYEINRWEQESDPKTLAQAATGIMRNLQATGLFAATLHKGEFVEGVLIPPVMVSRVDPLLVGQDGYVPTAYAAAKLSTAFGLEQLAVSQGNVDFLGNPKLLPAHAAILGAARTDQSAWMAEQISPEHRAEPVDLVGEFEHKLQILRGVMLDKAAENIDAQLAGISEQLFAATHPVPALAYLDTCIRQAAGVAAGVTPVSEATGAE